MDEDDEVVSVLLSSAVNASIDDGGASGTIVDDDDAPSLSIDDQSVEENDGSITFTVTLSAASAKTVTVDHEADFGTASSHAVDGTCTGATPPGDDYAEPSGTDGTLTFLPGQTSKTIVHEICDDGVAEVDETFSVNLVASTEVNATIAAGEGIGTIVNDDNSTMTFGTTATSTSPYLEAGGSISGVFTMSGCPADCLLRILVPNSVTFTAPGATTFELISVDLEAVGGDATLSVTGTPGSLLSPTATIATHTINATGQTSVTLSAAGTTGGVGIDNIVFRIH
jgi:hypothetical protein